MPNPSGSVVSGWTKNTPKPDFFEKLKSVVSTCFVRQKSVEKKNNFFLAILDHFEAKMVQSETTSVGKEISGAEEIARAEEMSKS